MEKALNSNDYHEFKMILEEKRGNINNQYFFGKDDEPIGHKVCRSNLNLKLKKEYLTILMHYGYNINNVDGSGRSLLVYISEKKHNDFYNFLVKNGARAFVKKEENLHHQYLRRQHQQYRSYRDDFRNEFNDHGNEFYNNMDKW